MNEPNTSDAMGVFSPKSASISAAQASVEGACQEIKDLFARYGSGDYVPTEAEKQIIDEQLLASLLRVAQAAQDSGDTDSGGKEAASDFHLQDTDHPFTGSRFMPLSRGITLGCISPEARDLLDRVMEAWELHLIDLKKSNGDDYEPGHYGFAYWLIRWSGLVAPSVPDGNEEQPPSPGKSSSVVAQAVAQQDEEQEHKLSARQLIAELESFGWVAFGHDAMATTQRKAMENVIALRLKEASTASDASIPQMAVPLRIMELAERLTLPGGKCDGVSASELMEVTDWIFGLTEGAPSVSEVTKSESVPGVPSPKSDSGSAAARPATHEPRVRTLLRSMIHALDSGDSDTYWMMLGMVNTLHREMIEGEFNPTSAPSVGAVEQKISGEKET